MYAARNAPVAYFAHQRVASTAVSFWLKHRGFVEVGGHHQVPWGWRRDPEGGFSYDPARRDTDKWNERWWFESAQWEYEFCATVRNPFDLILSYKHWVDHQGPVTDEWIRDFMWARRYNFWCGRILFPAFQLIPGCTVLRYESLQRDLNEVLTRYGIEKVSDGEAGHVVNPTAGKPEGDYRRHLGPDERRVIENRFAYELEKFGYEW